MGWDFGRPSQFGLSLGNQAAKSLSDLCVPSFDQIMLHCLIFCLETKTVFVHMDLFFTGGLTIQPGRACGTFLLEDA